jgi:DNA-binding response OmpR family regulator
MKKTLLLVDDDTAVRQMLTRVLSGENYTVLAASNGDEALALARSHPVNLALLDLNLPKQSGWDIFEKFSSEYPLVPVVIVTARPNQLFLALSAGVGALFEKPLDFPKLLDTIRNLLAETAETRLARLAGEPAEFHYLPQPLPKQQTNRNFSARIASKFHLEL